MTHSQAAGFSQQFLSTIMSLPTTTMIFLVSPQPVWIFAVLIYYTNKFTNNKKYQMLVSVTQQNTVEPRKIPNEKGTFQSLSILNPRVFVIHTAINLSHLARRLNHLDKQFKTSSKLSHSKKPCMVFITWARKGWRSRVSAGIVDVEAKLVSALDSLDIANSIRLISLSHFEVQISKHSSLLNAWIRIRIPVISKHLALYKGSCKPHADHFAAGPSTWNFTKLSSNLISISLIGIQRATEPLEWRGRRPNPSISVSISHTSADSTMVVRTVRLREAPRLSSLELLPLLSAVSNQSTQHCSHRCRNWNSRWCWDGWIHCRLWNQCSPPLTPGLCKIPDDCQC